jgi:hypothetical protein
MKLWKIYVHMGNQTERRWWDTHHVFILELYFLKSVCYEVELLKIENIPETKKILY